ncbi:MAG: ornithine cyclodeaminase family protein [Gemmatimonadaceae bacterium]|nr:ornithine cyclodeaminase family protein [Gemmatimonadaceae bacterium]
MLTVYTAQQVHAALDWETLDSALTAAFAVGADVPLRHSHALNDVDALLLMPAWTKAHIGLKVVTFMPGAPALGAPTVGATYLLFDRATGQAQAVMDGDAITVRRTAAVSAIAARFMARADARTLLMVGTGHLSAWMVRAHCALRPGIDRVAVWGRDRQRSTALVERLRTEGLPVAVATDLEAAVRTADIVSCATTARSPVVLGEWISPGTHVDLVGGFTRDMREVDDAAVSRSRIAVDSYRGALAEAGDLVVPLETGVVVRDQVVAELAELVRGDVVGRTSAQQVTLFKSVGTALADLAAAQAVATSGSR